MADTTIDPTPDTDGTEEPPKPTQRERGYACQMAIDEALIQHGCRMVVHLATDYVGEGDKALTTGIVRIIPNEDA